MKKSFPLRAILSITGERLLTDDMQEIYSLLHFMCHESPTTFQLPRFSAEAKPYLLKQYPQLAKVDDSGVNGDNWQTWLAEQEKIFGKTLELSPIPVDDHDFLDAAEELKTNYPHIQIIDVDDLELD